MLKVVLLHGHYCSSGPYSIFLKAAFLRSFISAGLSDCNKAASLAACNFFASSISIRLAAIKAGKSCCTISILFTLYAKGIYFFFHSASVTYTMDTGITTRTINELKANAACINSSPLALPSFFRYHGRDLFSSILAAFALFDIVAR